MRLIACLGEEEIPVEVERSGSGYRVRLRDQWIAADLVTANAFLRSLRFDDGKQFLILHHSDGARHELLFGDSTVHVEIRDPLAMRRRSQREDLEGDAEVVRAVMPGRVVRVLVAAGDQVQKGDGLLVVEAMKMENEITAPRDGAIAEVLVEAGQTLDGGTDLIRMGD